MASCNSSGVGVVRYSYLEANLFRSMPAWAQKVTIFLPPRYYVEIMRSVYLKGSTFADLSPNYLALCIFALAFSLAATLSWRKRS